MNSNLIHDQIHDNINQFTSSAINMIFMLYKKKKKNAIHAQSCKFNRVQLYLHAPLSNDIMN